MRQLTFPLLVTTLMSCLLCQAAELHVPSEYETIQRAIVVASDGDVVLVAPGDYSGPGFSSLDFIGKEIRLESTEGNQRTTVSITETSSEGNCGIYFRNIDPEMVVIKGFTFMVDLVPQDLLMVLEDASPIFSQCQLISENFRQGGMEMYGSSPVFDRCKFIGPFRPFSGDTWSRPVFGSCEFTSESHGIDFSFNGMDVFNCLFFGNSSQPAYSFISNGSFVNCTFFDDESSVSQILGGSYINCIIWNGPGSSQLDDPELVLNCYEPRGPHSIQPGFVDPWNGDFRLLQVAAGDSIDSPCIDAGSVHASDICVTRLFGETCLNEWSTRRDGVVDTGIVDIGYHSVHEFWAEDPVTPTPQPTRIPDATPTPHSGKTLHVPDEYLTIQEALDVATDGDLVLVGPGEYTGVGNRDLTFNGKAVALRSTHGEFATVIRCDGSVNEHHRGFIFNASEDDDTTVSGFTIINGWHEYGGAVFCENASATITHCNFVNNTCVSNGGAIYLNDASMTVSNCIFDANNGREGYIMWVDGDSSLIVANSEFKNAPTSGNIGIYTGESTILKMSNCLLYKLYSAHPFYSQSTKDGSYVTQCTFTDLSGTTVSGTPFDHCIYWALYSRLDISSINHSILSDKFVDGHTIIREIPLFIDADNNDYRLQSRAAGYEENSPAIDVGMYLAAEKCTDDVIYDCMDRWSATSDGCLDTGPVDLGYHWYRSTEPPTPMPTYTPTVLPTETPSPDPTSTPTAQPTTVPSSTPTIEPTVPPTATPSTCAETGVSLSMPAHHYDVGDTCFCSVTVCNAESNSLTGYPLFVILDLLGSLYFAPSFNSFDHYLHLYPEFTPGETVIEVIPEFIWPDTPQSQSGIMWFSALVNPEVTEIVGTMDSWEFGW